MSHMYWRRKPNGNVQPFLDTFGISRLTRVASTVETHMYSAFLFHPVCRSWFGHYGVLHIHEHPQDRPKTAANTARDHSHRWQLSEAHGGDFLTPGNHRKKVAAGLAIGETMMHT